MADVAARARKLGTMHGAWPAWLAAGIADRHRGKLSAAREAVSVALEIAPGATPAHIEMVGLLLGLGEPDLAVTHAERAIGLEGSSPRALKILAKALMAAGRREAGLDAVTRALAMQPGDEELRALLTAIRQRTDAEPTLGERVRAAFARWSKRRAP
jgi:tetratricopeptide (TPR) repeat protein